jgi:hypothetical protein
VVTLRTDALEIKAVVMDGNAGVEPTSDAYKNGQFLRIKEEYHESINHQGQQYMLKIHQVGAIKCKINAPTQ